jgi:hypothetical protein
MNFIKKLFGKNKPVKREFSDEEFVNDYELKTDGLEAVLGKMHDMVGHAVIPFAIGGTVDMYYFPNHIMGTGFATMEILEPDGSGPLPNRFGTYELVAFTKYGYCDELDEFNILSQEDKTKFTTIERKICGLFTDVGSFSRNAVLNPNETCEFPADENEDSTYMIFDLYEPDGREFKIGNKKHHLLLCMQIFKSEMEFSRANGSAELFKKLKTAGHYPYSDLDRQPVV